jgi:Rrf2 family iron-sulfur cluster assembly transcriptional regulator
MFSKACEYGIKATLFITQGSNKENRVTLKEIAKAIDSPEAYTAKILQQLARSGIIKSHKGPNGGFYIESERGLVLGDIVEAIDGDTIFRGCGLGLAECSEAYPCPLHDEFVSVRDNLRHMLETVTLQQLAVQLEAGATFLKR